MNTLFTLLNRWMFVLQRSLGVHPALYYTLRQPLTRKPELATDGKTELVIEGFPRSANSFSVVAFEQAQNREVRIAHHLHVPAQIIRGVRRQIPTVVLLRDPVSAIASLVIREPSLTLSIALWDYINFHAKIEPYQDHFLVVRFEDVVSDFGGVVSRINERWDTCYAVFEHHEGNVARAFAQLDALEKAGVNSTDENRVARPSSVRACKSVDVCKELLSSRYARRLDRARALYSTLLKKA